MALPQRGVTVEHDLRGLAIGQVVMTYEGRHVPPGMRRVEIECEVYEADGIVSVHAACPKCRHAQWIDGRNKRIEYSEADGTLFIERFTCPWEMSADRQRFGLGLCRLTLTYDGNTAHEAV